LHNDEIRQRIGTRAEEFDFAMKEITAQFKKLQERLDNVMSTINAAVETAKQNGGLAPEMEDAQRQLQQVVLSYRSEPNKYSIGALDRLTAAMENLARATSQLSLNYAGVKKRLDDASSAAKGRKGPGTKDRGSGPWASGVELTGLTASEYCIQYSICKTNH